MPYTKGILYLSLKPPYEFLLNDFLPKHTINNTQIPTFTNYQNV